MCIFSNVGLGDAAKREVGTGANQIPDMSAWTSSAPISGAGWRITPDGFIEQWGPVPITSGSGAVSVNFPIPFPSACHFATTGEIIESTAFIYMNQIHTKSLTGLVVSQYGSSAGGGFGLRNDFNTTYYARGR